MYYISMLWKKSGEPMDLINLLESIWQNPYHRIGEIYTKECTRKINVNISGNGCMFLQYLGTISI